MMRLLYCYKGMVYPIKPNLAAMQPRLNGIRAASLGSLRRTSEKHFMILSGDHKRLVWWERFSLLLESTPSLAPDLTSYLSLSMPLGNQCDKGL